MPQREMSLYQPASPMQIVVLATHNPSSLEQSERVCSKNAYQPFIFSKYLNDTFTVGNEITIATYFSAYATGR